MTEPMRNRSISRIWRDGAPLASFAALAWVLYAGLDRDHEILPSPLIGKPVPQFDLPSIEEGSRRVSNEHYAGRMHLLSVWVTLVCRLSPGARHIDGNCATRRASHRRRGLEG